MTTLDRALPVAESPFAPWRRRAANVAIAATPLVVGGISSIFTMDGLRVWYRTLDRPDWNPPDWVFGPVWTTLYVMMGIALVQVVRTDGRRTARRAGIALFAIQLVLNFGWSWIFFTRHDLGAAVLEILALWLVIVATIAAFARIRPTAAALLVPYLAWVTFATVLTAEIWRRNR
jgi:tryptophan-rich sensory protein